MRALGSDGLEWTEWCNFELVDESLEWGLIEKWSFLLFRARLSLLEETRGGWQRIVIGGDWFLNKTDSVGERCYWNILDVIRMLGKA